MNFQYKYKGLENVCKQILYTRFLAYSLRSFIYLISIFSLSLYGQVINAQTFDSASTADLRLICNAGGGGPSASVGAELSSICNDIDDGSGTNPLSSGVGAHSQPNSILISQQQLKDAQTNKEKEEMVGGSSDVITARWGENFSTFLTAGATTLRHKDNEFEDGYSATIPSITVGGSYLISKNLETGLAFNYSNSDGDYKTGGGFNVDSYSPLLFINYLPFQNAFTHLVLGYTRQDHTNNRTALVTRDPADGAGIDPQFRRKTQAEFNTNQFNLSFLSGYDFSVENFTFGPRVGVNVSQWDMESYTESSNTGLELSYNSQHQTSVQSKLGLAASFAQRLAHNIVIIPQLSAFWVHEFENDSRTIKAKFIQAPDSAGFNFQTERPDKNWMLIDVGLSLLIQKQLHVFANFSTVQGNSNFESYGGNLGIRVGW